MTKDQTKKENQFLEEWFDKQFHSCAFDGRLQVGYRSKGNTAVLPLATCEREKMKALLVEYVTLHSSVDYYITANTISGVKRKTEELFSLENIVIDIDCHEEHGLSRQGFDQKIDQILRLIENNSPLPKESSVVRTGRGVQLWWSIVPCHAKCKPYYDEVKRFFMSEIASLLTSFQDLTCFTVDKTASTNPVGYFRLPGTYNTKVKEKVTFEVTQEDTLYVLQDLVKLAKEWSDKSEPVQQATIPEMTTTEFSSHEVSLLKNFQTFGFFRSGQLIKLRLIRNLPSGKEERNNFCFLMYNTLLPAFGKEKALEKLYLFNKGFKEPLTHKEIEGVICTAKQINGYKYSNQKIIEFLNITPEEQDQIGLYAGKFKLFTGISSHPSRKASAALAKEHRNKNIIELANSGKNGAEIAKLLQVSQPTIRKVLHGQGASLSTRLKEKMKTFFQEGKTMEEIAQMCNCSLRSVQRYRKSTSL